MRIADCFVSISGCAPCDPETKKYIYRGRAEVRERGRGRKGPLTSGSSKQHFSGEILEPRRSPLPEFGETPPRGGCFFCLLWRQEVKLSIYDHFVWVISSLVLRPALPHARQLCKLYSSYFQLSILAVYNKISIRKVTQSHSSS